MALFSAANWQLVAGKVYEKWDAFDLASPYYSLLADFTRAGRFLYWNPWLAGGSPDFAVAGSGTFSPDMLLCAALTGPGGPAYEIYWMAMWLAGGMGMLLLARHLEAPVWGGLVVAIGFVFSGFYTGHAEHNSVLYSYSCLPFIIWRIDAALMQRRFLPALQAGALWGLSALAGYPALTVYTFALATCWTIGRCLVREKQARRGDWKFALLLLFITGAVGAAILSPSYVSAAYEGRGYSDRSEPVKRSFALDSNALHPWAIATLSSPSLVELKLAQGALWSYTDVSSLNLYTGSITLLLALLAVVGNVRSRWRWYLLAMALGAIACAMSHTFPFRGWLYDLVPPTRYFRHSSMLRGYFLFIFSVLALYGGKDVQKWRSASGGANKFLLLAPLLAFVATIVFAVVTMVAEAEHPEWLLAAAHLALVWGGLTLLALALRRDFPRYIRFLPASLLCMAALDGLLACHFSEGTLYNKGTRPELPLPANSSIAMGPTSFRRAPGTGRANINFFFKVPTLRNYAPFKNRFQEAIAANPDLAAMALGDDRTWFAPDPPDVPLTEEAFIEFANRVIELKAPIFLKHSRDELLNANPPAVLKAGSIASTPTAIKVPATVLDYEPDKLALEVNAPTDGWVMITERWSRSWKASVNGIPRVVECANFIFRAVPVVTGKNKIELAFDPKALPELIFVSWSTLGLVLLLSLVGHGKGKVRDTETPSRETASAAI